MVPQLVWICLALVRADSEESLRQLILKHAHGLNAIQTLDVEVEARRSDDGGRTWRPIMNVVWRKDGPKHRFVKRIFEMADPKGRPIESPPERHDFYCDGGESREVWGWDPAAPPQEPLGPRNRYGGVRAVISQAPPWVTNHGPPVWLFFSADRTNSLSALEQLASEKKLLGKQKLDGLELWAIRLVHPETKEEVTAYLDENRKYTIARRELRIPPGGDIPREIVAVQRVLMSKEIKPGIHFPMHVQGSSSHLPSAVLDVRVLSVKINDPLPRDAFDIAFPPGALVKNLKTGEAYIWGDHGPAHTFANQTEFEAWERQQLGRGSGQVLTRFFLINAGFLAAIVLIMIVAWRYGFKRMSD